MIFPLFLYVFLLIYNVNFIVCDEIVVRINGGETVAQLLAKESGHFYKGPVMGFSDTFVFIPLRDIYENHHKRRVKNNDLIRDYRVLWAEKQSGKIRQKRDFIDPSDIPKERTKRNNSTKLKNIEKRSILINTDNLFNDELWNEQWYLETVTTTKFREYEIFTVTGLLDLVKTFINKKRDTRSNFDLPKLDLNVLPVYKVGITGKGVRISVLDDGIEYTHDDLKQNYDKEISWDCNEEDRDPLPRYDGKKSNSHGTRCAGEIAMLANNVKCGVGIAFDAKIGGVRMLDGLVTDRVEATALGYAQHLVDIYSASWGPNDDGKTVDGPGRLAQEALERGIRTGRNGKGTIFVWASGNGGHNGDNCNCDGYLNSPYTISIGSASEKGEFPWYGEACASTLAVTYSSGTTKDHMITTTDLNNMCTTKHTGTSASAPLAAGIIALMLEANPDLTWRDVQHLIVWTSELAPLRRNPGWQQNSAGLWFNERFGFGLMNAFNIVKTASKWINVPQRTTCRVFIPSKEINSTLSAENPIEIIIPTAACENTENHVRYLEHVEVKTNINYTVRGALQIHLLSPSDTEVQLLAPRKLDKSKDGFNDWTFMSVVTWGEPAAGVWTLRISDATQWKGHSGNVGDTTLILHGTSHLPYHMKNFNNSSDDYRRIQNRFRKNWKSYY